jgi:membrane fusion protein, multidrug efflux system
VLAFVERHVVICLLGAVALVFLFYEATALGFAYSGDSYVDADVISVAPQLSGPLIRVAARDDLQVKAGDLIAEIDPTPFANAVASAQAEVDLADERVKIAQDALAEGRENVTAAEATSQDASLENQRIASLLGDKDVSVETMDQARRRAEVAAADLAKARSMIIGAEDLVSARRAERVAAGRALDSAQYDLARTRIVAPVTGGVAPLKINVGDYVRAGEPILSIVSSADWRIIAEITERHLARLKVGQSVWFTVGSDPWRLHVGSVRSIAPGISRAESEPKTLPFVPLDSDWIRLARRFPVIIDMGDLPRSLPLYRGANARVLVWF